MTGPDRILEGLAATLEQSVLPALGSGFARGQLFAVLEVLGGLSGQLDWGGMLLENEASSLTALFAECAPTSDPALRPRLEAYASLAPAPLSERLQEGRALLCELIAGGRMDAATAAAVDAHLANDTLFKAMALRPTRLGEISQG